MLKRLILLSLLSTSLTCQAVGTPKRVFIHAVSCTDTIPLAVISSLRDEIRGSNGYQLVTSLSDDGGTGVVLTIYINCAQVGEGRAGIAAIAFILGQAENCSLLGSSCEVASNEFTLQSMVCGGSVGTDCGRALFRSFDNYWSGPNSPPLDQK